MKLTFVNVGYGEAILLECPDPAYENGVFVMLIDGGSAIDAEFAANSTGRIPLTDYLAADGPGHIDLMVSSHIHEDHTCGLLPVAERWAPAALWQSLPANVIETMRPLDDTAARTTSQRNFMKALNGHKDLCEMLRARGGTLRALRAGECGELCKGLTYQVLAPSEGKAAALEEGIKRLYAQEGETFFTTLDALDRGMNNVSLMLLLDWQGTRVLLPGDTNARGYDEIDPAALQAHIFKVGHHGQKDGADQQLLDVVRPEAAVCCASSDRRYDSAHPEVLELMRQSSAALYFSDCPQLPGLDVPPHRALTFVLGSNGTWSAEYQE